MSPLISRSLWRKIAVTCLASLGFVLLYEASVFDSRGESPVGLIDPTAPAAGSRLPFTATAYCKGTTTASGVGVRTGIAASDPAILPVGSVVNLSTDEAQYNGVYTIMDTGPAVLGRILDLFMGKCDDARAFGRRPVEIAVLRLGWSPTASTPSLIDRLFRRREAARSAPAVFTAPAPDDLAPAAVEPGVAGDVDKAVQPASMAPGDEPAVDASAPIESATGTP